MNNAGMTESNMELSSTQHNDLRSNSSLMVPESILHASSQAEVCCSLSDLTQLMKLRGSDRFEALSRKYGDIFNLCSKLNTSVDNGLYATADNLNKRRELYGANMIPERGTKNFLWFMWDAFTDLTLIVLTVAAIVSIGLSFYHPPRNTDLDTDSEPVSNDDPTQNVAWIEGVAILVAVVVIVLVTAANDYSKELQFRGLQKSIDDERKFATIRCRAAAAAGQTSCTSSADHSGTQVGELMDVKVSELVVGDICQLKYGDTIPADGLLIQSNDLRVDESSLTGESKHAKKSVNGDLTLYADTHVMEGSGKMVVICVGIHTQAGQALLVMGASNVKDDDGEDAGSGKSVLRNKLDKIAKQIGYIGIIFAVATFLVLCIRFSIEKFIIEKLPWDSSYFQDYIGFLILAITILVIAIPEGLPLAVMLSLAYSVKKMMKDNNLVRHLDACETMGNATTICCDKTGTLTANRMTVVHIYTLGRSLKHNSETASADLACVNLKNLLATAVAVNAGYTSQIKEGPVRIYIGNKTECALLSFVLDLGYSYESIRQRIPEQSLHKVYTFNSMRKWMTTVVPRHVIVENEGKKGDVGSGARGGGYRVFTKGAAEIVLHKCAWILLADGQIKSLSDSDRQTVERDVIEEMASRGLRTICIAYKDVVPQGASREYDQVMEDGVEPDWENEEEVVSKLICLSIVGIEDPIRPEVLEAIQKCQKAGITVRMVTGDNLHTAYSVAKRCGIIDPAQDILVLEGPEFNEQIRTHPDGPVSQERIDRVWPQLRVLARSSPQDKYNLVKGIMNSQLDINQEVVAATGDGTNDGPALKKADVGFAMGITGTDVAKEASDIILLDDNFASIVKAVVWGRHVYDSIAKFLQFQLTVNVVALIMAFTSSCVIMGTPIKAIQIIWINLIQDTLSSLSLATELPNPELLQRKPYGRNKSFISGIMLQNILSASIYQLTVIFYFLFAGELFLDVDNGRDDGLQGTPTQHYTFIFNVFVLMTMFNEINARKINGSLNVFSGLLTSYVFIVLWSLTLAFQVVIVQCGTFVFFTSPLSLDQWMWCLLFGLGQLIFAQMISGVRILIATLRTPKVDAGSGEHEMIQESTCFQVDAAANA